MPPELIEHICTMLANGNARRAGIDRELRTAFPGLTFSVCDDNDIPSRIRPLAMRDDFALYGIDTGGHCAALTTDIEAAGGLAIALIN